MSLFLSPITLRVDLYYSPDDEISVFSILAHICPRLKELGIHYTRHSAHSNSGVHTAISASVRGMALLESISVHCLEPEALQHLAHLPSLSSLTLTTLSPSLPPSLDPTPFIGLQNLDVGRFGPGTELDLSTRFISLFREVPLDSLYFTLAGFAPTPEVYNFYKAISLAFSHSTLTALNLTIDAPHSTAPAREIVSSSTVRLLLCFGNLEIIQITSSVGFDLDDVTVHDMVGAWPRLQRLRLQSFHRPLPSRVTLQCLRSFAQYCPSLNFLDLAFDASDVPAAQSQNCTPHRGLNFLDASMCPITAPLPVARFLSSLFPSLIGIGSQHTARAEDTDDDEQYRLRWQEVGVLIRAGLDHDDPVIRCMSSTKIYSRAERSAENSP
jgi:hypothetical protein